MKRWKLGVVLAALLALLALPAWAEEVGGVRYVEQVQPDGTVQIRRVIEPTSGEGVVAWDAQNGDLAFAEAELEAYLSGAKPLGNGTLVDAGYLKMLVAPTSLMADESISVYVVAPGATEIKIVIDGVDRRSKDGEKYFSWFSESGGKKAISAKALINGTWTEPCEPVIVEWTAIGKLDYPQLTIPETCQVNQPVQIAWTPVENAEEYYWNMYNRVNGGHLSGRVGKETTSATVVLTEPGKYDVFVQAEAKGYQSGRSVNAYLVVTDAPTTIDENVQLTASKTNVYVGYSVQLQVTAEGADAYQIYPQGGWWHEYTDSTMWRWVYEDTDFVAYARVNGKWIGPSAPVSVKVTCYGDLETPTVTAPLIVEANEPFTISWTPVEHAEGYDWALYRVFGNFSTARVRGRTSPDVTSVDITMDEEGLYEVNITPYAEGWNADGTWGDCIFVTGEKAQDTRVQLSAPARVPVDQQMTMTVKAAGAQAYRIYRVQGLMEAEGASSTLSVYCDKPGKYVAYAKIDGAWQGPSAPVTVLLKPEAVLPSSLTEIKAEAFMGASGDFTAVKCPQGLKRIGARAFADCWNLRQIEIPASVTEIANDAFDGSYDVVICSPEGSYAQRWAQENAFDWITTP